MSHLLLARALFDLSPISIDPVPKAAATARAIDEALHPGHIALIAGPSGGGKSTILRHIHAILRARDHAAITVCPVRLPPRRRVVEAFDAPMFTTLSLLSSCGLADATILERRIHELSTGQRWRLSLAVALRRAQRRGPHATLLIDELGSTLDAATARCLCRTLRRWIEPRTLRAICATHDDSLLESLAPAVLAIQPLHAAAVVHRRLEPRMNADGRGSGEGRVGTELVERPGLVQIPNPSDPPSPSSFPVRVYPRSSVASSPRRVPSSFVAMPS